MGEIERCQIIAGIDQSIKKVRYAMHTLPKQPFRLDALDIKG